MGRIKEGKKRWTKVKIRNREKCRYERSLDSVPTWLLLIFFITHFLSSFAHYRVSCDLTVFTLFCFQSFRLCSLPTPSTSMPPRHSNRKKKSTQKKRARKKTDTKNKTHTEENRKHGRFNIFSNQKEKSRNQMQKKCQTRATWLNNYFPNKAVQCVAGTTCARTASVYLHSQSHTPWHQTYRMGSFIYKQNKSFLMELVLIKSKKKKRGFTMRKRKHGNTLRYWELTHCKNKKKRKSGY